MTDDLNELELENEALEQKMSIEEKKAIIAEAKRRYGKDWTKFFGNVHSGMDWEALKFKISGN